MTTEPRTIQDAITTLVASTATLSPFSRSNLDAAIAIQMIDTFSTPSQQFTDQEMYIPVLVSAIKKILHLQPFVGIQPCRSTNRASQSTSYFLGYGYCPTAEQELRIGEGRAPRLTVLIQLSTILSTEPKMLHIAHNMREFTADIQNNKSDDLHEQLAMKVYENCATYIFDSLYSIAIKHAPLYNKPIQTTKELLHEMARAMYGIASSTRRGVAQFILVDELTLKRLSGLPDLDFILAEAQPSDITSVPVLVGKALGTINVYVSSAVTADRLLMGYKGGSGEADVGYVFTPAQILELHNIKIDRSTFNVTQEFSAKLGHSILTASDESIASGGDYYRILDASGITSEQ